MVDITVGMMTIRSIPDEVHDAIRARAAQNNRSAEAEVRAILENTVMPQSRVLMGDALAALGRKIGLSDKELDAMNALRDKTPAEPLAIP